MSGNIGSGILRAEENSDAIAVIGMAARVPGAEDIEAFWENLVLGVESVARLDEATLLARGVSPARLGDEHYIRAAPLVDHVEDFDAGFFSIAPRDAAVMDPQIRLFLEITHATLENAGYDPVRMNRDVGVVAAIGPSRYATLHLEEDIELAGGFALGQHTLARADYVATTVSYRLDLHGPSMTVLTACSGSLAALHVGCEMLRSGDCEAVIVGGSNVEFPVGCGYAWTPGGILSPEGRCRPFDAKADGTLFGSGAAAVLLKPLEEALRAGDRVEAVVLGSAVNNDGADKVSFTAPSHDGQASVIMEAMSLAGVAPEEIGYVEAHGTGTPLGDPMEVAAFTEAYAALATGPAIRGSCGIGSVKGNIGHLGPVAGVIGFIKTVLALRREQLPPTINFDVPNPAIGFAAGPFDPVRELRGWPRDPSRPRRAAVSSLGIGGTNVHVVLGEAPQTSVAPMTAEPRLLVWSGRDEATRDAAAARLADWLAQAGDVEFADAAATLQHGRTAHPVRGAVIATSALDAVQGLGDPMRAVTSGAPVRLPEPAVNEIARFAELARRLPAFEPELREVLAGADAAALQAWSACTMSGSAGTDAVLAVAVRVALARVWIAAGADPAAIADPAGLPGVLSCLGGKSQITGVAAQLGKPPARSPDTDLWPAHLAAVARFWVTGASLAWQSLGLPPPLRRAALPRYPYARSRHWVDPPGLRTGPARAMWSPGWQDASAETGLPARSPDGPILVLAPAATDALRPLMVALRTAGADVVRLKHAADFAISGEDFAGRPDDPQQLAKTIEAMSDRGQSPAVIVHALGLSALDMPEDRRRAFDAVTAIARLCTTHAALQPVVVVKGSADVSGAEPIAGPSAELAVRSLAELPGCHWIDLGPWVGPEALGAAVLATPRSDEAAHLATALRGRRRWIPVQLPLRRPARVAGQGLLPAGGRSYLVIDGEGEFAAQFAEALADAGVTTRVVVATAACDAARAALLAVAEAGTAVQLLDWSGHPGDLPDALRPVARTPIGAMLAVATGNESVQPAVAAAAARLPSRPFDAAIAVRIASPDELTAARALAWCGSSHLDILGAERSLTVMGPPATIGSTVLELLASGLAEHVVSAA